MASASDLRLRFPDAVASSTAFPDALLDEVLAEAAQLIRTDVFVGVEYDTAQKYLAMHLLFAHAGARAQGIVSVSAGPASVSYASVGALENLNATPYGAHYNWMLRSRFGSTVT